MSVCTLDWEDPPEEGMATLSSILAWRIHGQRSLAGDLRVAGQTGLKRLSRHAHIL